MGLKICYALILRADVSLGGEVVEALHARALAMDFDTVSSIRSRAAGEWNDPIELIGATCYLGRRGGLPPLEIPPVQGAWFDVEVDGAEPASIGLASRPATVASTTPRPGRRPRRVASRLAGVCAWQGSCKTQYAALPEFGGIDNFLRAHISLIDLLESAREFEVEVDIDDDGGYTDHHDPAGLLQELEVWNRRIAAMTVFLDRYVTSEASGPLVAPIKDHPDFDRLAAEGYAEMEAEWARRGVDYPGRVTADDYRGSVDAETMPTTPRRSGA